MSAQEAIRELLHREPFVPFRIRGTSGEAYAIRKPELVVLMKSQMFVAAPNSDRQTIVPFLHIAAVETINGNGHRDRGKRQTRRK